MQIREDKSKVFGQILTQAIMEHLNEDKDFSDMLGKSILHIIEDCDNQSEIEVVDKTIYAVSGSHLQELLAETLRQTSEQTRLKDEDSLSLLI